MDYKILGCMTSFRRPMECMCQIFRFMSMDYPNFKMSVIVRGVGPRIYNQIIDNVQKFIDEGRLIIQLKDNYDHLTNLVQCGEIEEEFDYYAKIDDDDWYCMNYLNEVNTALNSIENCSGTYVDWTKILKIINYNNFIRGIPERDQLVGGTIVLRKDIFFILKDIKDNLGNIKSIYNKYNLNGMYYTPLFERGLAEDNLALKLIIHFKTAVCISKYNIYSLYRIYPGVLARPRYK